MAITIKSDPSVDSSSFGTLSKVADTAAPESENSRFESLPPEIRIMIYELLVPPARSRTKCRKSVNETWCQSGCILHTVNHAILSINRNIRREASAVFYRKVLLVCINWNLGYSVRDLAYTMPRNVAFKFIQKDMVLPTCVAHIRHKHSYLGNCGASTSMVVAAADFSIICRQLQRELSYDYFYGVRSFFSVNSLPKFGHSADNLSKLIWSPLLALQRPPGIDLGATIRVVDCTGIFDQSAALPDRDVDTNGEDGVFWTDEDTDRDARHGDTLTSSEEDSSEGDLEEDGMDEEESGGEESGQGRNGDEEDNDEEDSNHSGEN